MAKGSGGGGRGGGGGGGEKAAYSEFGGRLWEKGGNSRIYLDRSRVLEAGNISIKRRGTGSIERATAGGETISASAGGAIFENAGRVFYDRATKHLVAPKSAGRDYGAWDRTVNTIASRLRVPVSRR